MDHQAFAQLLGNYGEFIGAIAVVATLGYLSLEVRRSRRATYAATMQAANDSFVNINLAMISDEALLKAVSGLVEPQSPEDRAKYHVIMLSMYRVRETMFMLAEAGTTDPRGWDRLKTHITSGLKNDYARAWWKSNSRAFTQEFASYMDGEVAIIEKDRA